MGGPGPRQGQAADDPGGGSGAAWCRKQNIEKAKKKAEEAKKAEVHEV